MKQKNQIIIYEIISFLNQSIIHLHPPPPPQPPISLAHQDPAISSMQIYLLLYRDASHHHLFVFLSKQAMNMCL